MRLWLSTALLLLVASEARPQRTYRVDAEGSRILVDVGSAGLFGVFGHDHTIRADRFRGEVQWNEARPERSRFTLEVDAASLTVADEDVSAEDRAQIQSDMESKALDLPERSEITFTSTAVEVRSSKNGVHRLNVTGTFSLRGVSRPLEVPFTLEVSADRLVAEGELELASDEWGVPQISVAGGTVKTSEDLGITFEIVALSEDSSSGSGSRPRR